MLIEENDQTEQGRRTWLWSDCKLVLRRTNSNNPSEQSYENLEAEVQLESDEIQQPFIPFFAFCKSFYFDNQKGFYSKKGIPLPSLVVKLQKSYLQLLQEDQQIIMIYCELAVAYPRRKETHFYLDEVITVGDKKKPFSPDGTVQFDGIVIKESSMQKANSKFSFLVSICVSSIEQNKIILKTLISTAFYSENPRIRRKKFIKSCHLTLLVSPNRFLKPISSLKSIMDESPKQVLAQTLKYLNEKQKFSFAHPFYLIYHFSNLLRVFYHSEENNSLDEVLDLISSLKHQQSIQNEKDPFIRYELKKTKRIEKAYNSISGEKSKKVRRKIKIYGRIQNTDQLATKPLLVTFNNSILQLLKQQIEDREYNGFGLFRKQVQELAVKMNEKLQQSGCFYIKIDLFKVNLCSYFGKISREIPFSNHTKITTKSFMLN